MCKPVIVKERKKNAKKLNMKNVLNDQKSKIFHTQFKLQGEVFKFSMFCHNVLTFYPNWQGTKLIINYSQILT